MINVPYKFSRRAFSDSVKVTSFVARRKRFQRHDRTEINRKDPEGFMKRM